MESEGRRKVWLKLACWIVRLVPANVPCLPPSPYIPLLVAISWPNYVRVCLGQVAHSVDIFNWACASVCAAIEFHVNISQLSSRWWGTLCLPSGPLQIVSCELCSPMNNTHTPNHSKSIRTFLIHFPIWLTLLMRNEKKILTIVLPQSWLAFFSLSLTPTLFPSQSLSLTVGVSPDSFLWLQNVIKVLGANCFDTQEK